MLHNENFCGLCNTHITVGTQGVPQQQANNTQKAIHNAMLENNENVQRCKRTSVTLPLERKKL